MRFIICLSFLSLFLEHTHRYSDHWQIIEVRPTRHSADQKSAAAAMGGHEEKAMDSDLGGTGSAAAAGGAGEYTVFAMVGKGAMVDVIIESNAAINRI